MLFVSPFFIGIICSFFGTLLPGILNGTIVRIYKEEGFSKANTFAFGALTTIALQTYLAVFFAKMLYNNTQFNFVLREIGFVLFLGLSMFFFLKKKSKEDSIEVKVSKQKNRYLHGVIMSLLNVFPVFFYMFISFTCSSKELYVINPINNLALTLGVLIGTYAAFRFYMFIFKNKSTETNFFLKNINVIIGSLTLLVALVNLYKLMYE